MPHDVIGQECDGSVRVLGVPGCNEFFVKSDILLDGHGCLLYLWMWTVEPAPVQTESHEQVRFEQLGAHLLSADDISNLSTCDDTGLYLFRVYIV